MDEYISREAVFQVVHGIARGIATKDIEALKAKDMKTFYKIKGAKEILDSVDTDLCYIPVADVQSVEKKHLYAENGSGTMGDKELDLAVNNFVDNLIKNIGTKYVDAELELYILETIMTRFSYHRIKTKVTLNKEKEIETNNE